MNKAILIGNLGRDPEARYTPSGQMVVSFPLATNRQYTAANGEKVKQTIWFRISAWSRTGEIVNEYCKKGSKLCVECRIDEPYAYVDDDGKAHGSNQATAVSIELLSSRGENESQSDAGDMLPPEDDGELPF